jgi:hypothetical protein
VFLTASALNFAAALLALLALKPLRRRMALAPAPAGLAVPVPVAATGFKDAP